MNDCMRDCLLDAAASCSGGIRIIIPLIPQLEIDLHLSVLLLAICTATLEPLCRSRIYCPHQRSTLDLPANDDTTQGEYETKEKKDALLLFRLSLAKYAKAYRSGTHTPVRFPSFSPRSIVAGQVLPMIEYVSS